MEKESFWRPLIDFFLPPKCPLCGRTLVSSSDLPCPNCLAEFRPLASPRCPRCGQSFASEIGEDHLCAQCLTEERFFAQARAASLYEGLVLQAIRRFKYGRTPHLARPLGTFLAAYRDPDFPSTFDLVLPVPLHTRRLRERGFNQSLLLARRISRARSIPLDPSVLRRVRYTRPQTELSGGARQENVRGAFQVKDSGKVAGRKILLVDDVFTTGATVQECAKILLKSGARRVDVLTLARVLPRLSQAPDL